MNISRVSWAKFKQDICERDLEIGVIYFIKEMQYVFTERRNVKCFYKFIEVARIGANYRSSLRMVQMTINLTHLPSKPSKLLQ